jgi:hypothetical protein
MGRCRSIRRPAHRVSTSSTNGMVAPRFQPADACGRPPLAGRARRDPVTCLRAAAAASAGPSSGSREARPTGWSRPVFNRRMPVVAPTRWSSLSRPRDVPMGRCRGIRRPAHRVSTSSTNGMVASASTGSTSGMGAPRIRPADGYGAPHSPEGTGTKADAIYSGFGIRATPSDGYVSTAAAPIYRRRNACFVTEKKQNHQISPSA